MIRLTRAQVREVDRRSIEEFHVPGIVLMENAARGVTDDAMQMLRRSNGTSKVTVICGGGNNGGDALAVARHLHNRGVDVTVALFTDPHKFKGDAEINWQIVQAMKLPFIDEDDATLESRLQQSQLVIDGIFGTGLQGPPRNLQQIEMINRLSKAILAIDLPSGMDCDTGKPLGACVRAARTVTFVAEKAGFANHESKQYTGEVTVADIGCPRELIYNKV